ncbi:hypothetical protein ACQ86B_12385 [Mycolicibacterium aichiense]|uniref:hypothetical protein n=1 Tax=Mycolicibacterium aichiense TaxID=1799 RepID=UPI003D676E91
MADDDITASQLCAGETYKTAVKMAFAKGAALGNTRRAIDFHVELNMSAKPRSGKRG